MNPQDRVQKAWLDHQNVVESLIAAYEAEVRIVANLEKRREHFLQEIDMLNLDRAQRDKIEISLREEISSLQDHLLNVDKKRLQVWKKISNEMDAQSRLADTTFEVLIDG